MMRATTFFQILKELEGRLGHEKTLSAAESLCANQFFSLLQAGSYVSEKDSKASLLPTSLTGKILESIIAAQGLGNDATNSIISLCRRAVLENTLIGRATNLDRIMQFAAIMQKTKSGKINGAIIAVCEKHSEIFVEEQKTNSFMLLAEKIPDNQAHEEELISFMSEEAIGLWKLVCENRSGDFLNNQAGFLRVHRQTNKRLPKGYPETIEGAVSKYLKSAGESRLEEALKNFYSWEILLMEKNSQDTNELVSDERVYEFTCLLALIPQISESVKNFRFPLGESNQTFQLLDSLFKTYALVYENIGVYYNQDEAKEIASIIVPWRATAKESVISLIKENDKFIPVKQGTDKSVLEFRADKIYSLRRIAANKTPVGDWSSEPSFWTCEIRKAFKFAFAELQKKKIEFIAASADCYAGALTQGCEPDLRMYVKAEESSISIKQINDLIRQSAGSRGISTNLLNTEIKFLSKETQKARFNFSPDNTGAYILWPTKQQLLAKKTDALDHELVIWFDGKIMSSSELLRNELSNIMSGLSSAIELSADGQQKKEHYHAALNQMEELLRENPDTFKRLLAEAYNSQKTAGDEEIYIQAAAKLSGADQKIIKEILKQNKKTNPHLQPDYKGGPWHDHISNLKDA
jgi:hypothetical protein